MPLHIAAGMQNARNPRNIRNQAIIRDVTAEAFTAQA